MLENLFIRNLYDLSHTAAAEYLEQYTYPWEALAGIGAFICKLGETLSPEEYEKRGEDVWIAKSATVFPSAYIHGPASSALKPRSARGHLSEATPWWAPTVWWATRPSSKM